MKRFCKILCLAVVLTTLLLLTTILGSASGACELNGVTYGSLGQALNSAITGDTITLTADVEEPVRITKEVNIVAGEYEFKWYSTNVTATVTDGVYSFTSTKEVAYVDWYIGHKCETPERLQYTVGSTAVYYGSIQYGDYTLADNELIMSSLVDENGEVSAFPYIDAPGVIFTRRANYISMKPRFKVISPDGNEQIYNISTDLKDAARDAADGSTIVLLDDIFFPYYADGETTGRGISVKISGGKTIYFDFAGYDITAETKITMFQTTDSLPITDADGNPLYDDEGNALKKRTTLYVYSSKPDANLILGQEKTYSKGGCVMTASSGTDMNFGDFGEYSGRNINAYAACAVNVYSGSVVNISGASIYRICDDFVGFIYHRSSNSTINMKNARIFAVRRDIQICLGSKSVVTNANLIAEDTLFATLALSDQEYSGTFIRYISDGANVQFKNCTFDRIPFSVQVYTKSSDPAVPKAVVEFDKNCSFDRLPKSDTAGVYHFSSIPQYDVDDTTPEYIFVNDKTTDVIKYPTMKSGEDHDYNLAAYQESVGGVYKFTNLGYREEATEIVWYYNNNAYLEWWEIGSNPYPFSLDIPKDSDFVDYVIGNLYPVEEGASYDVNATRKFELKYNMTLANKLKVNIYIPVFEGVSLDSYIARVSVGTNTITGTDIIKDFKTVDIDGKSYYKVIFEFDYAKVPRQFNMIFEIVSKGKNTFTEFYGLKTADYCKGFLDGDYPDTLKNDIKGMLYKIVDSYAANNSSAPAEIVALVEEKFGKEEETAE